MAKVLQERENERKENRRNNCHCRYRVALPTVDKFSQTMPSCTISYSEFEFYHSEPEEEEEEEVDEEDADSTVNPAEMAPSLRSDASRSSISPASSICHVAPNRPAQFHQQQSARRPTSWMLPSGARPPGGPVAVRTTMTTSFDEIIKTSMEEEARLPTPLFGGHLRHRNPSSASQLSSRNPHSQHYDNQHMDQSLSSAMSTDGSEQYNNHSPNHDPRHLHHYHSHYNHHHDNHSQQLQQEQHIAGNSRHGDPHSTFLTSNTNNMISNNSDNATTSDNNSIMTAATSNGNVSSSYRDTPPPSSLQRSSSSSLSSPSSGLPPLSIPTSASITTDLNGDIMIMSSSISSSSSSTGHAITSNNSSNSSHAMSSACNTPSSCSNASTSGIGGSSGNSSSSSCTGGAVMTGGIFHEPLSMPRSVPNANNPTTGNIPVMDGGNGNSNLSSNNSIISSSAIVSSSKHHPVATSNVVTIRKGTRLSTSHISNICANGSITSVTTSSSVAANGGPSFLTRSTSWSRDKVDAVGGSGSVSHPNNHGSSSSIGSSASSGGGSGGGLGLMTSLGNHWRSTVLVHHPPRSHSSYEPLSLVSVQGDGTGGQQTTFSATLSPKSVAVPSTNSNAGATGASSAAPPGPVDSAPSISGQTAAAASHNNDFNLECISDSEQPLLQHNLPQPHHHQYGSNGAGGSHCHPPSTYLFHAYHNPQQTSSANSSSVSAGNGFFGSVLSTNLSGNGAGYTATSTTSSNTISSNSNQYYRAQKRTFWARSSSTTSTETEI